MWVFCILLISLSACETRDKEKVFKYTKFAMDTVVEYTIMAESDSVAGHAMERAHEEMLRVDSLLWEENPVSEIYRFNHSREIIELDREAVSFLKRASDYHEISQGAFDVTIKPVLDLYDFKSENASPPSSDEIPKKLKIFGMEKIRFRDGKRLVKTDAEVSVAVGGLAKGYAVDRAIQILKENGIRNALVNAGGDLYCLGAKRGEPWAVGVQDPDNSNRIIEVLYLSDMAAATSGDYQRYFMYNGERYHHILDPKDGRPARGSRSATIIAETTEKADALATALFILGRNKGIALIDSLPSIEGMVIDSLGEMSQSSGYESFIVKDEQPN
jgi:thiamine biosynthesis lipoprotein